MKKLAWLLVGAAAVATGVATAQQPPPQPPGQPGGAAQPMPPRPGMPGMPQPGGPGLPPGHPGMPQPGGMQPGMPGMPGMGQPGMGQPGMGQPGRPGLPPGHPPIPGTRRPPPPVEPEEHAAHAEHCPGEGPMDAPNPRRINWWQGLLGVDNDKAVQGKWYEKLLYRYDNPQNVCDPKNQPPPFTANVINFLVLVGIIYRFGKKPISEALVKRKRDIMHEIETASRLRRESEKRLADYEDKFENIEETLAQLKADYAAQAEAEQRRMVAEAEERRARMKRDTELRLEQERKEAQAELLREAVRGAAEAAEQLIQKTLQASDADRLAEEYLTSLGAVLGGSERRPPTSARATIGGAL